MILIFLTSGLISGCGPDFHQAPIMQPIKKEMAVTSGNVIVGDGLKMHYLEAGEGAPLLLIHGWMCSAAFWQKQLPNLAKSCHVVAVDCIGCGFSDKPLGEKTVYSIENQAQWILDLMDQLNLRQVSLAGHSMGGHIAAEIAIKAPGRVKRLMLLNAAGLSETPRLLPWYLRAGRFLHLDGPAMMVANGPAVRAVLKLCMYHEDNPVDEFFLDQLMITNFSSHKNRRACAKLTRQALFQEFIDDRLQALETPTLLIWGLYDKIVPPKLGVRYNRLLPDARLVFIEEAGHLTPLEKPQKVSRLITNFLKQSIPGADRSAAETGSGA